MAIVRQRGLQRTVDTIADRDAIRIKPEYLVVQVKDASADKLAKTNPTFYRWTNVDNGKWLMITDDEKEKIGMYEQSTDPSIDNDIDAGDIWIDSDDMSKAMAVTDPVTGNIEWMEI